MNSLAIRSRLTIMVVVLTALLSAVAGWIGFGLLKDRVESDALAERAAVASAFSVDRVLFDDGFDDIGIGPFGFGLGDLEFGDLLTGEPPLPELDAEFEFDPEFELDPDFELGPEFESEFEFEVQYAAQVVDRLDLFGELVPRFGSDQGTLQVLLTSSLIVDIDARTGEARLLTEPGSGAAAVSLIDLAELDIAYSESLGVDPTFEPTLAFDEQVIGGVSVGLVVDITDQLRDLTDIRNILGLAAILLTLLTGSATYLIAGSALRPVGAITERVGEISSGSLDGRVPEPARRDEIGLLARTMNAMLSRLETSDLRRRQFVSDASHELRTPVAVLRSEAEVAKKAPDSTSITDLADVVLAETSRLALVVEDLLILARADEAGTPIGARREVDVDELVLDEAARPRRLPVDIRAVSGGRVLGDAGELQKAVAHLLNNAARHAETHIDVGVRTTDRTVRVWIDDDGPGVPSAERARVFQRFVRLDDARTRDSGGAGLGLAVVRATVESSGGTIEILDSPLGGARFELSFPSPTVEDR